MRMCALAKARLAWFIPFPIGKVSGYIIITTTTCLHIDVPMNTYEFMQDLAITSNVRRKLT